MDDDDDDDQLEELDVKTCKNNGIYSHKGRQLVVMVFRGQHGFNSGVVNELGDTDGSGPLSR